jgi:transposase-like protein
VTRAHVEERTSFRVLAKRYREKLGVRVSPSSLQRMVYALGLRCKTPREMSAELGLDMWRGYLVADDKHIDVGGKTIPWYLGVDSSGDIVHAVVMREPTVGAMVDFFEVIRDGCRYRLRGLTTDQEQLFGLAFRRVYARKPHQYCIKHALDTLDRQLGYQRQVARRANLQRRLRAILEGLPERGEARSELHAREDLTRGYHQLRALGESLKPVEELRAAIRRVLFSRTYGLACSRWANFFQHRLRRHPAHGTIERYVTSHWHALTVHYRFHGMPNTNNIAERTMEELERRLKTIESFGNPSTARAYINLLIAYLRAKPFTDCRGHRKYRNGLSRLELAGAELPTKDWLKLALKP